jgi:nicotinamide phosphoribosyltransferase
MMLKKLLSIDGYKLGHKDQYPEGIEYIFSNLTPRKTSIEEIDSVIVFGINRAIKKLFKD